jgi:hypothetical protein
MVTSLIKLAWSQGTGVGVGASADVLEGMGVGVGVKEEGMVEGVGVKEEGMAVRVAEGEAEKTVLNAVLVSGLVTVWAAWVEICC